MSSGEFIKKLALYIQANERLREAALESLDRQHDVEAASSFEVGDLVRYRGKETVVRRFHLSHDEHELADEDRRDEFRLCWEICGDDGERLFVPLYWKAEQ